MATPTLAEAITASFYAWEVRGRGWTAADYAVALEPPFRPFFLLPGLRPAGRVDDGRRPTLGSRLLESVKAALAPSPPPEPTVTFEEAPPHCGSVPQRLQHFRLLVPEDHQAKTAVTAQLVLALGSAMFPIAFEVVGSVDGVVVQVSCAESDALAISAHIEGYVPEAVIVPSPDALREFGREHLACEVVEFGLGEEFFLPIADGSSFPVDPLVPLLSAMDQVAGRETLALQVVFERTRNPWARATLDALDDGEGGCLIEDAPWFLKATREKLSTPLFAVSLRVCGASADAVRCRELVRSTAAFVLQFGRSDGNELVPLTQDGVTPEALLEDVRERTSHRTGMLLSAAELVGLVHLPDRSARHTSLLREVGRTVPLPAPAQGHPFVLGQHEHRGVESPVTTDLTARFTHTWVIGGSGTGKSTLLANLVLQDVAAGHGAVVLDPHGDLIDDITARIPVGRADDVILFDPTDTAHPVGLNVLRAGSDLERDLLGSDLVAIFRRFATSWGDTMSSVLGNAVLALVSRPEESTLLDLKRFLVDEKVRDAMLATVTDPEVVAFWTHEYPVIGARSIGPLLTRLDGFLRSRVVRGVLGQQGGRSVVDAVFDGRKVLLARLAKGQIGAENAYLLGSLLLSKVNEQALMRQAVLPKDRHPVFVYADEGQHYVTPSIEALATEGRKYKVGLVFAHQALGQLSEVRRIEGALLANCHTRIVFRVGDEDAASLAKGFAHFDAEHLTSLGRGEAVFRIGGAASDCNLRTKALPAVTEANATARQAAIREATRSRYGGAPLVVQPTPIPAMVVSAPGSTKPARPAAIIASSNVVTTPTTSARTERLPMEAQRTEATPGRGGALHKYLQQLVKRLGEERGFRATVEALAGGGQADVLLEREGLCIGCEISVTTNTEHELANLRKCIDAGFGRVLFISPERKTREKVSKAVADLALAASVPIDVAAPEDVSACLDALPAPTSTRESVVKGYKVKVKRVDLSAADQAAKRSAVAGVIAKSVARVLQER